MKRILMVSDLHCGHQFGLAHPEDCVNDVQKRAWDFFDTGLRKYAPYDVVFCNGDAIDGNARRNGGIELITSDRLQQCDMATKILRKIAYVGKNIPEYYFTRGTPYHTGQEEDFENVIAQAFPIEGRENIGETMLVNVENVIFDLKHKVGGGSLPHTKTAPLLRDVLIAIIKENIEGRVKADVFVRSHVHTHCFVEAMRRTALVTPALEINSAYGQRQCSGLTDFGFVVCEVEKGKVLRWVKYLNDTPIMKEEVVKACASTKK